MLPKIIQDFLKSLPASHGGLFLIEVPTMGSYVVEGLNSLNTWLAARLRDVAEEEISSSKQAITWPGPRFEEDPWTPTERRLTAIDKLPREGSYTLVKF